MADQIAENYDKLKERIFIAAHRAGRDPQLITLLGVTKFQGIDAIKSAYRAGIRYFGENKVQEALSKYQDSLKLELPGIHLDMIGNLQKNKINKILAGFSGVQSIDSLPLLSALLERAVPRSKPLRLFLELHTGEDSKSGFPSTDDLVRGVEFYLQKCESNKLLFDSYPLVGLMTMAPFTENIKEQRNSFKTLRNAYEKISKDYRLDNFKELSMGMSMDFETAIEEGATIIRIGTALFGARSV
jgi:pyridoxal phosphate enzyme (YggS family)